MHQLTPDANKSKQFKSWTCIVSTRNTSQLVVSDMNTSYVTTSSANIDLIKGQVLN